MTVITAEYDPPQYGYLISATESSLFVSTAETVWLDDILEVYTEGGGGGGNLAERFRYLEEYVQENGAARLVHRRLHRQNLTDREINFVENHLTNQQIETLTHSHNRQPQHQARVLLTVTGIVDKPDQSLLDRFLRKPPSGNIDLPEIYLTARDAILTVGNTKQHETNSHPWRGLWRGRLRPRTP